MYTTGLRRYTEEALTMTKVPSILGEISYHPTLGMFILTAWNRKQKEKYLYYKYKFNDCTKIYNDSQMIQKIIKF